MNEKQQTIEQKVSIAGIGLHTGKTVNLTLVPAAVNSGIRFKRIDLEGQVEIPALVDYVVDTSRGTVLEKDGARVHTVGHLLSAIRGLQLDNVVIELDGPEIPICDGSAQFFLKGLLGSKLIELD